MRKFPRGLAKYLLLTFLITGISWWLLALLTHRGIVVPKSAPYLALHILGGFGPTIAALLCVEPRDKRTIRSFILGARKGSWPYLLTLSLLFTLTIVASSGGMRPDIPWFAVPIIFLSAALIGGGNEELGWRGILQPTLEQYLPFPVATLITGTLWGLWHVPLWFIEGMAQREMSFPLFLAFGLVLSFYLAGLFKYSRSVWQCMLFHGLSNTLISTCPVKINARSIAGLILLTFMSLVVWYRTDRREAAETLEA